MKTLFTGLVGLALITGTLGMLTFPMSAGTQRLVTVQTRPTLPDWRGP
jgi:hypothetical protein